MPTMDEVLTNILSEQARMGEQIKAALKRIDEQKQLTESVHELAMSVKLMAQSQENLEAKVGYLAEDVSVLKQKPAKRWESLMGTIITVVATAVMTYFITKFGLN